MDFSIHTVFKNKHITIILEDTKFTDDGYETIVGIIDTNEDLKLEEYSEDEYFKKYPEAESFIDKKIMELVKRNKEVPYEGFTFILN